MESIKAKRFKKFNSVLDHTYLSFLFLMIRKGNSVNIRNFTINYRHCIHTNTRVEISYNVLLPNVLKQPC